MDIKEENKRERGVARHNDKKKRLLRTSAFSCRPIM